jgi:hypothetical protein
MSTARVTSSLTKFGGVRRTDCTEHVQATSVTRSLLVRRETHHLLNDPDSSGLLSDIGHELSCSTSSSSPSISECIYEARTSDRILPQVGYLICCALAATHLIMHARTVLYTKHLLLTILPTSMAVPQSHLLASVPLPSTRPCSTCRCLPEHQFTKLSRSMTSPNPSSGRSSGTSPCVGASTFGPGLDLDPFACDCDPELAAAVCSRADVPAVEPSGTDFEGEG